MKSIDFKPLRSALNAFLKPQQKSSTKLVLIRSCENQGNLSGTLNGWTDARLTDFGRKQAFMLSEVMQEFKISGSSPHFDQVHASDLTRAKDSSFYALGFPSNENYLQQSQMLRELDFGEKDGLHYDGLSQEEKAEFSKPDFHAPGGESWVMLRQRVEAYFSTLGKGNHLVFTHGGPIVTVLQDHGLDLIPNNGSIFGVSLGQDGAVQHLDFEWHFPHIPEEI